MLVNGVYIKNVLNGVNLSVSGEYSSIRDVANGLNVDEKKIATICYCNHNIVMQSDWNNRKLSDGDNVLFASIPAGGGGGDNKALMTVLSLAVMGGAGWLGNTYGASVASATGLSVEFSKMALSAVGVFAGQSLVSAVIGRPQRDRFASIKRNKVYNIGADGNKARLGESLPVVFGRTLVYPDWATAPYAIYKDNQQYLRQVYIVSVGDCDIETLRIGSQKASIYDGVKTQIKKPNEVIDLFDANVYVSQDIDGQQIPNKTHKVSSTNTVIHRDVIDGHGYVSGTITTRDADGNITKTVSTTVFYKRETGGGTTYYDVHITTTNYTSSESYFGNFPVCPEFTKVNKIAYDLIFPKGLYDASGGNIANRKAEIIIECREIGDNGLPVTGADWFVLESQTIEDATGTPLRLSFTHTLNDNRKNKRYEARVKKTTLSSNDTRIMDDCHWGGLRGIAGDNYSFGNVTTLAVEIKATDNISKANSRKINCIAKRNLSIYDGTNWSQPQYTRSIAWAVADILRNADYGYGLADKNIDIDWLKKYDGIWTGRGDYFDGELQGNTVWECVNEVLRCGRAKAFQQSNVIKFYRDEKSNVLVQQFSLRNIIKGSFKLDYLLPPADSSDGVEIAFLDNSVWRTRTIKKDKSGGIKPLRPERLELNGITDENHIRREMDYLLSSNKYGRSFCYFETELEGLLCSIGDRVKISHNLSDFGVSGDIVYYDSANKILTLDRDVELGTLNTIILRDKMGKPCNPISISAGDSADKVVLATTPTFDLYYGYDSEKTQFAIAVDDNKPIVGVVMQIMPKGETVGLTCLVDNEKIYVN